MVSIKLNFLNNIFHEKEKFVRPLLANCIAFQADKIWIPDVEILNLKEFKTLDVLSKLEGLWLNRDMELIYAVACRISWICPMTFDNFPLDFQVTQNHPSCVFLAVNTISRPVSFKLEVLITM